MKPSNLKAHWIYSTQEWNEFVEVAKAKKKEDNFYFGLGIVTLGTIGLMILRDTGFLIAVAFAIPLSILIPWLRMKFSYKHLVKGVKNPEVKIFDDHLKINNHVIELKGSQKKIKSIKIIEAKNGFQLLEFDVQWLTRKGPTNDEYRVLIPFDKIKEAENIVKGK
ncbi:hypothetical protein OD91_1306 [Lutibacter sp. Hel_I_33_5]|uniref:hypothetical protein n=1 Tax=Lutibacter sp. Hel_I_33_5 TaxID=1566289 RepID=UPI00119F948E|nr:hypothetical protein [Lutibacter sp. Hel_I_33_5]TVZ56027.1 hypothetical protein OD91_1306 [Lutibacter sp. Hel_I_33_5]